MVSAILVVGIGGLTLDFGFNELTGGPVFQITALATALIAGIITNLIVNNGRLQEDEGSSISEHVKNMSEVDIPEVK